MAEILIATRDEGLAQSVKELTSRSAGVEIRVCKEVCEIDFRNADLALALIHTSTQSELDAHHGLLRHVRSLAVPGPVLVICEDHNAQAVIETLRLGVLDCLFRPLDLRRLRFVIESMVVRHEHVQRIRPATAPLQATPAGSSPLQCDSPAMREVIARARRAAARRATVLITGETGVGKNLLARLIHSWSEVRDEPFLAINCLALPEHLVESELFGHRRGAFTGADQEFGGMVKRVGRGTLLLDEINSLPLSVQGKLLHLMDDGSYMQVGSASAESFEGRLIVSSNVDLEPLVAAGQFRADLYYRMNVVELSVPPLRERREEILPLVQQFLRVTCAEGGEPVPHVTEAAERVLQSYHWPGNIRELKNVVERAAAYHSRGEIRVEDLPGRVVGRVAESQSTTPAAGNNGRCGLRESRLSGERKEVIETLKQVGNNRTEAARMLGISRAAFYKRLKRLGLMGSSPW